MRRFLRKLGWLRSRSEKEDQLAAELQFHLEQEAGERQALGLAPQDAQWAARRDLGNLAMVQENTRAAWSWTWFEQMLQDIRFACRTIRRSPSFTILAALSLALGIGANTAIYSLIDAVLMRSLPAPDPGSLVAVNWHFSGAKEVSKSVVHNISGQIYDDPRTGVTSAIFPYPAFESLRKSTAEVATLFARRPAKKLNVLAQGQAEVINGEYVSGNYFEGLGLAPAVGRFLLEEDDRPGTLGAVVLSYAFAQSRFGDAASALGKALLINNVAFTVVGVAPRAFFGVDPSRRPDLYLPLHADLVIDPANGPGENPGGRYLDQHYYWTEMMGRLRPGVTLAHANAALQPAFERWVAATASKQEELDNLPEFLLKSAAGGLDNLRRKSAQPLFLLLSLVGLLLAIACANVANLLLARSAARKREMAVRLSMGASRWRMVRQLLTESLLLASLGGAAGLVVALWSVRLLLRMLVAGGETPLDVGVNLRVMAASFLLTMLTGLLFGLAPALRATRLDPMPALREARAEGSGRGRWWQFSLGRALMVSQIAISLLLLVGAGLLARTLANLQSVEMGFQRENVLVFKLNARQAGHKGTEILSFYDDLEKRFSGIPGVLSATMTNSPLIGDGAWGWPVVPLGKAKPEHAPSGHGSGAGEDATRVLSAGIGFFATMHIPLLAGRAFDVRDRLGAPPVAVVNEAWARWNFDGRNPVGQHVVSYGPGLKPREMEIVGLARNTRYDDMTGRYPPIVYLPFEQNLAVPVAETTFLLRTAGEPLGYARAVREIVREADARIPATALGTQIAQIEHEMAPQILFARLCALFAGLALVIACVGLYGTTSYTVARRTGEIGIRMALGARRGAVVWMVLRDVLILAGAGLAISLPISMGAGRLLASLLYGVKPGDLLTSSAAAAILLGAAVVAGYLPARRASRIDPMTAVRHE